MLLIYKRLTHFIGVQEAGNKKGDPKNAGMSHDVHENKGQKIRHFGFETMLLKINELQFSSNDFIEKKGTCRLWGLGTRGWETLDKG
jgi:hypothetical protein